MEKEIDVKKIADEALNLVDVDYLKYLYMVYKDYAVTETEIMSNDVTQIFEEALADKVEKGELIVILIRGEVRTGKSTVGLKIKQFINDLILKFGRRKKKVDEFNTICSDQTEFVRWTTKRDEKEVCVLIDEYNTMAEGGANASTEQQLLQTHNDMFATFHVHRINCNPTQLRDSNAFIHLEVIGRNLEKKVTRCKLIYCNNLEGDVMPLGYVDIAVGDIIKNWEDKVKDLFEMVQPKDNDSKEIKELWKKRDEVIKEWKEKDWYVRYVTKKIERLNLIVDFGVRDVRELEFSVVVLEVFSELRVLAESGRVSNELIVSVLKDVCRENKLFYSFYAETIVFNNIKGILGLITEQNKYKKKLLLIDRKAKLGKMTVIDNEERKVINVAIKKICELKKKRVYEEVRLRELYEEYLNIK